MKHTNKHRDRTQALREALARRSLAEQADNAIEQHEFNKLIEQGVIIEIK